MKSFLKELAEKIVRDHPKLSEVTIVLPNRRAALYLRKYFGEAITKPVFAPSILTIEDYIKRYSSLKIPDKLELIHILYEIYHQAIFNNEDGEKERTESFDQFYFWGEMLLRDFDEIDKYMINAEHIFKDLSNQKELDSIFDYLTEEQQQFLKSFWSHFEENQSLNKKRFLHLWRQLPQIYTSFRDELIKRDFAFEGMLHRQVAESIARFLGETTAAKNQSLVFAGFNALTAAEEKIISACVTLANARVYWDIDQYYINNKAQEAGRFFREYQDHPVLKNTFPSDVPSNFSSKKSNSATTTIKVFGAAQPVAQTKLMAEVLHREIAGFNPEETLIVLPDEKLLTPVLHGVSDVVDKMNVTMGFSLSNTPLFNLIEILADLHITRKDDHFNHRQTLALLGHPYIVAADPVSSNNKRKEILRHNWVHIPASFLASEVNLHRLIFRHFEKGTTRLDGNISRQFIQYLKDIIVEIGSLKTVGDFDKEYAYHFHQLLNNLEKVFIESTTESIPAKEESAQKQLRAGMKSFLRLFRQLVRAQKIPFSGEPLKGLQIMGMLETRNLDFKNVFILSLNEGSFPSSSSKGSYIPFNIRKAYQLPTTEHHDSIYAYLFYRILQRAENIFLFYNSETDVLGQGEMSRYLQQLIYESGLPIEKKILNNPIQPEGIKLITVEKTPRVIEDLFKLNDGNMYFQGISPSALNTYIECRLKFYFRHVAKIKEPNEVEEDLDARVLGNFLHDVMERYYKSLQTRKSNNVIEGNDLKDYEKEIDDLIDQIFIKAYRLDPERKVTYEGQRLVVKEVVKRFAHRIIEMDRSYAPFHIEALEQGGLTYTIKLPYAPFKAVVSGKIDRVDRKGEMLRIIDYKTGKDKLDFQTIESLFSRENNRNKAAFQTLLYALLYRKNLPNQQLANYKLTPGLFNRLNLFDEEFSFGLRVGKENITDVEPLLPEFEARLTDLFIEMFDAKVPFDQTTDLANCKICPYSQLCYR